MLAEKDEQSFHLDDAIMVVAIFLGLAYLILYLRQLFANMNL
jgi:hypothetical protein